MNIKTPAYNLSQAQIEAQRCLGCFDAPCIHACPANVNIPGFIQRFAQDNLAGASQLIYSACPLGAVCGMACPTPYLCEGACVLPGMGQEAVHIGRLQAFIAQQSNEEEQTAIIESPRHIAIIGAGPSGLGCAVQLRRIGHAVDVYEKSTNLGGLLNRVIPIHRLPQSAVDFDLQRLQRLGIQFHLGFEIGSPELEEICSTYDAVFLGIGLDTSKPISLPGMQAEGVYSALPYLEQHRRSKVDPTVTPINGRKVVVVGGGNVALDAAIVARRSGAEHVIVLYRRSKQEMPGWEREYLEAASLGIEFRWLSIIHEIQEQHGKVCGVVVQPMRFKTIQADGRRGVQPDPEQPAYPLTCDLIILAAGQALDPRLPVALNLPAEEAIAIEKPIRLRAGGPVIFAAGEAVAGGETIIAALSQGMQAGFKIAAAFKNGGAG